MPRHQYKKRGVKNDPVYGSHEVAKLINYIMLDGKRSVAQRLVYQAFDAMKAKNEDPIRVLTKAIHNVAPTVEVRPRRLGGASYLVPTEVRKERRLYLALNWIINGARARSNKEFHSFDLKLLAELMDAANGQGQAMDKKNQVEKIAEQNKAFAHLKW